MEKLFLMTVEEQLNNMHKELESQTSRLKELEPYQNLNLSTSTPIKGGIYYYSKRNGSTMKKYIPKDSEVVSLTSEAHYLKLSINHLRSDIAILEKLLRDFKRTDRESVIELLPSTYRNVIYACQAEPTIAEKAARWKAEKEAFKKEYNKVFPDKYPEYLRIEAADGRMMRSKAEAQIADLANSYGLVNIHELPHYCNGKWLRPDLTILSPLDGETRYLIDHEGLLMNPSYQNKHMHNQICYMEEGFKPNINLFYSFDYFDGSFSLAPIKRFFQQIMTSLPPKSSIQRRHPDDIATFRQQLENKSLFK